MAKDSPGDHIGLRGGTMLVTIDGQEMPLGGDIILSVEGIAGGRRQPRQDPGRMSRLPSGAPVQGHDSARRADLELTGKAP